jgi:hypothetical protein
MQSNKQVSENLTLKSYEKKVKEDIRLIHENLHEMLKLVKIEDERTMRVKSNFNFPPNEIMYLKNNHKLLYLY